MATRKCDRHGGEADVSGGKVCSANGLFICHRCLTGGIVTFLLFGPLAYCPLCKSSLR
jgi:hypothetical protein